MKFKPWKRLTITDNFLFQKVMQNNVQLCKMLIEKILGIRIVHISYPAVERVVNPSYRGKSVRFDVFVIDDKGVAYDIEMQPLSKAPEVLAKRSRYYQSINDVAVLEKGDFYTDLKKSYVIFICTFDPIGSGRAIYTFEYFCKEDKDIALNDGGIKVFMNSKGNRDGLDKDVVAFLDYVDGKAPTGFAVELDEAVQLGRTREEWRREYVKWEMEIREQRREAAKEAAEKAAKKAVNETKKGIVVNLLEMNMSYPEISKAVTMTVDDVRAIAAEKGMAY